MAFQDEPMSDKSPEERILLAAIDCINEYGLDGTTVKVIAEHAEVNQAAISYYYRGKDKLIEIALQRTLENAFNLSDFSESENFTPKERIIHIFDSLMEGALRYPGIARSHFHAPLMHGDYTNLAIKRINAFMDELTKDIASRYKKPFPELRESLMAIAAATFLYTATLPEALKPYSQIDLRDAKQRKHYIQNLANRLLP